MCLYSILTFLPSSSQLQLMCYITCIIIFTIVQECCPSKPTVIDDMIEASGKRKPVDSLWCHVCHSETETSCYNLTENDAGVYGYPRECDTNSTYCLVRKFSFTLTDENQTWPMKTFGIKRNCSAKCEPGCVIMGERTRLYVCNACCQGDNCNIGSGSEPKRDPTITWIWSTVSLTVIFTVSFKNFPS